MHKWDNEEKKQPTTVIDFRGNHIHLIENDVCLLCHNTVGEIKDGVLR